jgi:hypothetical protein
MRSFSLKFASGLLAGGLIALLTGLPGPAEAANSDEEQLARKGSRSVASPWSGFCSDASQHLGGYHHQERQQVADGLAAGNQCPPSIS